MKTHSTWNGIVEATGSVSAGLRGEPVSRFGLTDDEEDLRGRAWRFLVPAHERAWFARALADLVATRVLPADVQAGDGTVYFRALQDDGSRSAASRYRRLSEDIGADLRLLGPLAAAAGRVLVADRVRLGALDHARDVSPADVDGARARIVENRCLLAWVSAGLDRRLGAYRFALEHLVIETPQADAVPAERALARLAAARPLIEQLAIPALPACAEDIGTVGRGVGMDSPTPLVRKG